MGYDQFLGIERFLLYYNDKRAKPENTIKKAYNQHPRFGN